MINLRYHIVSLTAVFLAIGIGLTLGSTFLDRATVENLNGQLENLEARLQERDEQIDELQSDLDDAGALQAALDEQGSGLLAGRLDPVPVVVVAAEGVDEDAVDGAVGSLQVAGADVQGLWWVQDRFLLGGDADVTDLASALEEDSNDPARLRRMAVAALADALLERQQDELEDDETADADADTDAPADPDATSTAPEGDAGAQGDPGADAQPGTGTTAADSAAQADVGEGTDQPGAGLDGLDEVQALFDAGFVVFEAVDDGPDGPALPAGVRVVLVGGSESVPDDVVLRPLLARMVDDADQQPLATVVTSALGAEGEVSELVAGVRDDERTRALVSTVDDIERFPGWMALVLAVEDLADDVIGHYGLGEGASSLLPPLQVP